MSYSGTVRCRYCGQEGHNRRTCEGYKARLNRQAADGNQWAKAQLNAKNRKSVRKCGWCNETGHNKRTCPAKASAYDLLPNITEAVDSLVKKAVADIGRGSILNSSYYKGCVALSCRKSLHFGGSHISEETVEKNRKNDEWLLSVLRNLTDHISYKCATPSGETANLSQPLQRIDFRDVASLIGGNATTVTLKSPAPIERDIRVKLSSGCTGSILKGWIAVINLLLEETVFGVVK